MLSKPEIVKKGIVDVTTVEVTGIVWGGTFYRFESVNWDYTEGICPQETRLAKPGDPPDYCRFVQEETGTSGAPFSYGLVFASAWTDGETVRVYGTVNDWSVAGRKTGNWIAVLESTDLHRWSGRVVGLTLPSGWYCYNTSVCKTDAGYAMAIEIGEPPEVVGVRFTTFFARSVDGIRWALDPACYDTKTHYSAAPFLRFLDGWYYLFTGYRITERSKTSTIYAARSRDLMNWQWSPHNPVLVPAAEDRLIHIDRFTEEQKRYIAATPVCKVCDFDMCEVDGKTLIHYCWGFRGRMFYNRGEYAGTIGEFCRRLFPVE